MNNELNESAVFDVSTLDAYAGYFTDKRKVLHSASGGAATALSEWVIGQGGAVFGVTYSEDFKSAHYGCAQSLDELDQFRSSKYIATEKKMKSGDGWVSVYAAVEQKLREGRYVLFIGLGCDVAAVLRYVRVHEVPEERLFTVDLICHGPTDPEVQKQYVESLEKKYRSKVRNFSVRYKKLGWKPPFIRAEFENGRVFEEQFYTSDFGYAFQNYSKPSCYHCKFKGTGHCADITLGDYWGCTAGMPMYNPAGVSLMICHTEKGKMLIQALRDSEEFFVTSADKELAVRKNKMYYTCREKKDALYETFAQMLKTKGLHYAVTHSSGYPAYRKRKWKRKLKEILAVMGIRRF